MVRMAWTTIALAAATAGAAPADHRQSPAPEAAVDWSEPATGLERDALDHPDFPWQEIRGKRCRVHYVPGTFAARHIAALTRSADGAVERALERLEETGYHRPLDVFYIETREEMISLIGVRATGFADHSSGAVFLVCNPEWRSFDVHEITHVIAMSRWGLPALPEWWIREGLSVAVDSRCREHAVHEVAAEYLRRGELPSPRDLIERFAEQGEMRAYLCSGSLVAYLLERYGAGAVREIWQRGGAELESILGTDTESLGRDWRARLGRVEGTIAPEEWALVTERGCG